MAYEKQTWVTGEVITKEKLNHMEDGIANGGSGGSALYVGAETVGNTTTLDKTWNEIKEAVDNGQICISKITVDGPLNGNFLNYLISVFVANGQSYTVEFGNNLNSFSTDDPNGFPSKQNDTPA